MDKMNIDEIEDIDNVDLEEQMYQMDMSENEEENDDFNPEDFHFRDLLTANNLDIDLSCAECDRKNYSFKKNREVYTGHVLCALGQDAYVFSVKKKGESEYHTKKFYLYEIIQIK